MVTVGQRLPKMVELAAPVGGAVLFEESTRLHEPFEWGHEVLIVHQIVKVRVLRTARSRAPALTLTPTGDHGTDPLCAPSAVTKGGQADGAAAAEEVGDLTLCCA